MRHEGTVIDDSRHTEEKLPETIPVAENYPFSEQDLYDARVLRRRTSMLVQVLLKGNEAADSEQYSTFFISPFNYPLQVLSIREAHASASSEAGTVTIEKLTGTQAPGVGVAVINDTFDLAGAIHTVVKNALSTVTSSTILAKQDRLALKGAGGLSGVRSVVIVVELAPQDAVMDKQ